jgi:hypothetical protein
MSTTKSVDDPAIPPAITVTSRVTGLMVTFTPLLRI